jgi:hypothetical protein
MTGLGMSFNKVNDSMGGGNSLASLGGGAVSDVMNIGKAFSQQADARTGFSARDSSKQKGEAVGGGVSTVASAILSIWGIPPAITKPLFNSFMKPIGRAIGNLTTNQDKIDKYNKQESFILSNKARDEALIAHADDPKYKASRTFAKGGVIEDGNPPTRAQAYPINLENPMKQDIYDEYPAFKNLGDITLHPDNNFTRDNTGVGNIEYFGPEQEEINYPNGFSYSHPKIGSHGIVYNPNENNQQDVTMDMLHGMTKADSEYSRLRDKFTKRLSEIEDYDKVYEMIVAEHGEGDGKEATRENWIDGNIRAMMFRGTPEERKSKNYRQEDYDRLTADPYLNSYYENIIHHLKQEPEKKASHPTTRGRILTRATGGVITGDDPKKKVKSRDGFIIQDSELGRCGTTKTGQCAQFVTAQGAHLSGLSWEDYVTQAYGGASNKNNAWQRRANSLNNGGVDVPDMMESQIGDHVSIMYPGSLNQSYADANEGYEGNTHVGIVVGYSKDGTPVVRHNIHGKLYNHKINNIQDSANLSEHSTKLTAHSIYRPAPFTKPEFQDRLDYFYSQNIEKERNYEEAIASYDPENNLKSTRAINEQNKSQEGLITFFNNNRQDIMTKFGLSNDEYNKYAKIVLGVYEMESSSGESPKVFPKRAGAVLAYSFGLKDSEPSRGDFQIKEKTNLINEDGTSSKTKQYFDRISSLGQDSTLNNDALLTMSSLLAKSRGYENRQEYNKEDDTYKGIPMDYIRGSLHKYRVTDNNQNYFEDYDKDYSNNLFKFTSHIQSTKGAQYPSPEITENIWNSKVQRYIDVSDKNAEKLNNSVEEFKLRDATNPLTTRVAERVVPIKAVGGVVDEVDPKKKKKKKIDNYLDRGLASYSYPRRDDSSFVQKPSEIKVDTEKVEDYKESDEEFYKSAGYRALEERKAPELATGAIENSFDPITAAVFLATAPVSLPFTAATRVGKVAKFGAEMLNPVSGFKGALGKEVTKKSAKELAKNIKPTKAISFSTKEKSVFRSVGLDDKVRKLPQFVGKTDKEILDVMGTTIPTKGAVGRRKASFNQTLNTASKEGALKHGKAQLKEGERYLIEVEPFDNLPFVSATRHSAVYREAIDAWKKKNNSNILPLEAKDLTPEVFRKFMAKGYEAVRTEGINVIKGNFPQFVGAEGAKIGNMKGFEAFAVGAIAASAAIEKKGKGGKIPELELAEGKAVVLGGSLHEDGGNPVTDKTGKVIVETEREELLLDDAHTTTLDKHIEAYDRTSDDSHHLKLGKLVKELIDNSVDNSGKYS